MLVALVLAGIAQTACSSSPPAGPSLRTLGHGGAVGATVPGHPVNTPVLFPMREVCTTGAPITVTRVEPVDPTGGMRIVDWGIRFVTPTSSQETQDGNRVGRVLTDQDGFSTTLPVQAHCHGRAFDDVSVSVAYTATPASMKGIWMYYRTGGAEHRLRSQFHLLMCVKPTSVAKSPKTACPG